MESILRNVNLGYSYCLLQKNLSIRAFSAIEVISSTLRLLGLKKTHLHNFLITCISIKVLKIYIHFGTFFQRLLFGDSLGIFYQVQIFSVFGSVYHHMIKEQNLKKDWGG